ncbi:MAG: hypothetical protein ACRECC_01460 [Pseudolabrys sp.]|jgi:hypothetical protein
MTASPKLARVTLTWLALAAALTFGAGDAEAARGLLPQLLARAPATGGGKAALAADKLEACLRRARDLDKTGVALDEQMSDVQRTTAEAMFLQYQNNMQLPSLDSADDQAKTDLGLRMARHDELSQQLKSQYAAYQKRQSEYEIAVAAFERDCAGNFTRADLDAAKSKLQIK